MALTDRNLTVGTKLWARYKGAVHTAEVIPVVGDATGKVAYKLQDGSTFKSPSAAGAAIMGPNRTCNGWSFWTVGEPVEKPAKEPKAPRSRVNAAPKPERKRKAKTVTEDKPQDGNGHALPIIEQTDNRYECGECGQAFDSQDEAAAHIAEVHPA